MGIDQMQRTCTVVLHDDRVARDDVLVGKNILPTGFVAWLKSPGAKTLCIRPIREARGPDEISLHVTLAQKFGFENRTKATLEVIEDYAEATATHVELFFRDRHLSRADMWLIKQALDQTVMFEGQRVRYLGAITAEVEAVYMSGDRKDSAYATLTNTKLIFRSGSARYTLLIELSKEMLEYWIDGDLMYERLLDGYLPELFRRWDEAKVRHEVSVVLFGRSLGSGVEQRSQDFYYVMASDVLSSKWRQMLRQLKRLFNSTTVPRQVSLAAKGNILQAIHMAAMDVANDNIDPHLGNTGTSIIAITAGSGLFETTHDMLKNTTQLLMGNSIGVDIVALSPKPLHPVPLFSYQRDNSAEYALPHWVDISFWGGRSDEFASRWLMPQAGEDLSNVALPLLQKNLNGNNLAFMTNYDDHIYGKKRRQIFVPGSASATQTASSAETVKIPPRPGEPPVSVGQSESDPIPEQPVKEKPSAKPSMTAAQSSVTRAKRESLPPHSLMAPGRKISFGLKGLAPGRGLASTSVTTEHASQGRDIVPSGPFSPNEASSGIAQQIRRSLARKPSQQSMASHSTNSSLEATKPIVIQTGQAHSSEEEDAVQDVQQNVLATVTEAELAEDGSLGNTPKAKDPFYAAVKAAEAEGTWLTSPWLTLLNPCNPQRGNMRVAAQYRKWQHVFPRVVSSADFKWTSMCTPATLPLTTEYRPSLRELERYPSKKVRRLLVLHDCGGLQTGAQYVLERLIFLRLSYGFQIAITEISVADLERSGKHERILLSLGNVHHELLCLSDTEVQLVEYSAEPTKDRNATRADDIDNYSARIRGAASLRAGLSSVNLGASRTEPDWSGLDDQIVAQSFVNSSQGCSRMRLVLIPIEPPRSNQATARELSDEERHIEGIQKLTQLWQRNRYYTAEDQKRHVSLTKPKPGAPAAQEPNPLAIEYQTKDPSAMVNGYGPSLTGQLNDGDIPRVSLFSDHELFQTSTFDVEKLVRRMQEAPPHGVEVRDRRWFARLHYKCFRGDEMVNWLLRVFKDVESREHATDIGNELMRRGIFGHVRHKHDFRDGNYFYQITSAHRTTDYPDTVNMFARGSLRSIPPTPTVEMRTPLMRPVQFDRESNSSAKPTPILLAQDKKHLMLSQMMLYNVDPSKRSDQTEIVSLHYDRIHNPENCYHIQLEWINTTAMLIRESVGRWASVAESHGLRLVQLPLAEAHKLPLQHPFDQPVRVRLALRPPDRILATPVLDPHTSHPRPSTVDALDYQKALLRKLDFVLDYEAASLFNADLDVTYSHGKPDYSLTQFIHKSGLVLAQIFPPCSPSADSDQETADFLLIPNRFAGTKVSMTHKSAEVANAAEIIRTFVRTCSDEAQLSVLYEVAGKARAPGSPFTSSPLRSASGVGGGGADEDVPPISLPERFGGRGGMRDVG
ncbi:vacuolar membrane-associated protein iml1-like [Teratosphaeria destructans]|uniref:Vacuolar membrane-associated protein IML1 n=1 Tax=Teratosphaeria destructans TaxID=418781 RepID=A0A9W7SXQ9_9PEZI|nr:vacuolar membrane-associated protein iml1-like [Teratosphaeria destructans]